MATTTGMLTVEQVRALPDPPGGRYELHHGEMVAVGYPKRIHWLIQRRLVKLLESVAPPDAEIGTEYAFRPLPEHEWWAADVAYVSSERAEAADLEDNLHGAPDLVIEVLSPSNTAQEILDKEAICLANGCLEFWVVDGKRKSIRVTSLDRPTAIYRIGDHIPLSLFGDARLAVSDVFEGIR